MKDIDKSYLSNINYNFISINEYFAVNPNKLIIMFETEVDG